ncbi:MAG: carboxylating nicotinate-nucleotide diphosphorylase [Candidatus Omnitrophica bacterium]|nr:carboxylating nicotinate-nucleotide diphosphorylase [Candidatus Omnitrophota bacterium]
MNSSFKHQIKKLIKLALKEDIGRADITSKLVVPQNKIVKANIITKEDFILCGIEIAKLIFKTKDKSIKFYSSFKDGDFIKKQTHIADLSGRAHSILACERVALNFLCLLSGIATKTKKFVDLTQRYKVKIMDTRKTLPGLRILEKYAIRIGGGFNHRLRLDEMVLIKDNHLKIVALENLERIFKKNKISKNRKIEIEVKNLNEFKIALKLKPDIIMLDNMKVSQIREAVKLRGELPVELEASGGINLRNVKKIASLGVERISVGELTHSPESVEISLEIVNG